MKCLHYIKWGNRPCSGHEIYTHMSKYKEGNNHPSSVIQISLVHNHDKTGNKYYTQDNTNTRENLSVRIGARKE